MDKDLLQTLSNLFDDKLKPIHNDIKNLQGDVKNLQGDVKNLHGDVKNLQGDVKNLQGDIVSIRGNLKELKNNQTSFEIKLDNVVEQTANLTEFRSLTLNRLDDIADNLNKVESITASNWKDITKLKSVK